MHFTSLNYSFPWILWASLLLLKDNAEALSEAHLPEAGIYSLWEMPISIISVKS